MSEEVYFLPNGKEFTHDPAEAADEWAKVAFQLRDALERLRPIPEKIIQKKPVILDEALCEADVALAACQRNLY